MRIEFSVRTAGGERDVAVTAPPGTPLRDLASAIAAAGGVGDDATALRLADGPLTDLDGWGDPRLRRGAVLTVGPSAGAPERVGVVSLQVVGGPAAGRVLPLGRGRILIGRDPSCDLAIADPDLSRRHLVVEVDGAVTVRDLGSTNGSRIDGRLIGREAEPLQAGAMLRIGDTLLTVAEPDEAPAAVRPAADGTVHVLRSPRAAGGLPSALIEVPTRPERPRPGGGQWVAVLLPAAAGIGLAWAVHSPQFLLFALLSPVMMLATIVGDRWHWRRSRRRDAATYRRRQRAAEGQIAAALIAETAARRRAAPDPAAVARIAALPGRRLWARHPGDDDRLVLRVGVGDRTSAASAREGSVTRPAGPLQDVPVTVDLRAGPFGLAGPRAVIDGLAHWLVAQIAVHHSPAEVSVAFLTGHERAAFWQWARWLPHLRSSAAIRDSGRPLVTDLVELARQRRAAGRGGAWPGQWLVLVVDRVAVADCPDLGELLHDGPSCGVAAICLADEPTQLPAACHTVARVTGDTGTRIAVRPEPAAGEIIAVADRVGPGWAERVGRDLAPLVDPGTDGAGRIPPRCGLLETLGLPQPDAAAVTARWAAADGTARTSLGIGGDGPVEIDLTADGPHALVAGTTGAGKSELLQSLVAGLAAGYPPDELNLLLIDYKGGAAFAACAQLPHTAGLVTDLDPYLTERALRSLGAELRRRERLLAAAGAADLREYRAGPEREPIPRLVIVVDEFATLVQELPDFVRGLIGVAQRGRSLGVHLVLATQRPGSAVSPEIRANTALRIALRVTDPGESSDVIDAPDAALIERVTPGRAYVRRGATLTPVQVAQPSARTPGDPAAIAVEGIDVAAPPPSAPIEAGATDLDRLVTAIRDAAEHTGRRVARTPWRPPLPEALAAASLGRPGTATTIRCGRIDLPEELRQAEFELDLAGGETLMLAGAARSGRTEALTTLALTAADQLPPTELALHVVDGDGTLAEAVAGLPHAATVLGPAELSLVPRLLVLLERECARRGPIGAPGGPAMMLLVDGWDRIAGALSDLEAAWCAELLAQLLRGAATAGLSVAVAGDRSLLAPRLSAGFARRVALRLPDRGDFALLGIAPRDVPTAMPPGRGLRSHDGAAVQFAHAGGAAGPAAARARAAEIAAHWRSPDPGGWAVTGGVRLRPLPPRVDLAALTVGPGRLAVGLAGDEAECLHLDPFSGAGRLLVAGPPRSGRSTALRSLAGQAHAAGMHTLVAAPGRSPLAEAARTLGRWSSRAAARIWRPATAGSRLRSGAAAAASSCAPGRSTASCSGSGYRARRRPRRPGAA
jgi:S-DNA-T family DNA segregation ATPase FtsK/SpoIIIE